MHGVYDEHTLRTGVSHLQLEELAVLGYLVMDAYVLLGNDVLQPYRPAILEGDGILNMGNRYFENAIVDEVFGKLFDFRVSFVDAGMEGV